jgi:prephenate dehydrogenase
VRVAVAGTGMIGTSVALAARAAGFHTTGWDPDERALAGAAARGALDATAASAAEALAAADTVVIAAPLAATLDLLRALPPAPRAGLVVDVASVKAPVVAAGAGVPCFVATHPIAGSERAGPAAASALLFVDRTWAYVPPQDAALEERARAFIASLGAVPLALPAAEHDALVAFTSHLPQVAATALGVLLAGRIDEPGVRALCGTGMGSMVRLARSEFGVWEGILAANAAAIAQEVRTFADILRSVADAVESRDTRALGGWFAAAGRAAEALRANGQRDSSVTADTNEPA